MMEEESGSGVAIGKNWERVCVCEACERSPAAFLCKADAASLCVACDVDIHSANPLAQRHQRVPILTISGPEMGSSVEREEDGLMMRTQKEEEEEEEEEAVSWLLLPNPEKNGNKGSGSGSGSEKRLLFGGEVDEYLDDVVEYNSCPYQNNNQFNQHQYHNHNSNSNSNSNNVAQKSCGGGDSVVPFQCDGKDHHPKLQHHQYHNFQLGLDLDLDLDLDFVSSKPTHSYSYNGTISQSVSVSSLDIGVVPDSTMSDVSMSHLGPPMGTIDLFSGPPMNMPSQLCPMDREARVLRYREKKKTRKFAKTIRYASRKAYAETRPRIKGRFTKRKDVEIEVDELFSTSLMAETRYGIVPSF